MKILQFLILGSFIAAGSAEEARVPEIRSENAHLAIDELRDLLEDRTNDLRAHGFMHIPRAPSAEEGEDTRLVQIEHGLEAINEIVTGELGVIRNAILTISDVDKHIEGIALYRLVSEGLLSAFQRVYGNMQIYLKENKEDSGYWTARVASALRRARMAYENVGRRVYAEYPQISHIISQSLVENGSCITANLEEVVRLMEIFSDHMAPFTSFPW